MISTRPYRKRAASSVTPGSEIGLEQSSADTMIVDEILRTADGFVFYGWPAHRARPVRAERGRRISASLASDATVRLYGTPVDERFARAGLVVAVQMAAESRPNRWRASIDEHGFASISCSVQGEDWWIPIGLAEDVSPEPVVEDE